MIGILFYTQTNLTSIFSKESAWTQITTGQEEANVLKLATWHQRIWMINYYLSLILWSLFFPIHITPILMQGLYSGSTQLKQWFSKSGLLNKLILICQLRPRTIINVCAVTDGFMTETSAECTYRAKNLGSWNTACSSTQQCTVQIFLLKMQLSK